MKGQINWQGLTDLLVYDPGRPLLFNSMAFFLFFLFLYAGYLFLLKRTNLRILYLLAFSLFFYYKSSGWFFLLLLATTGINFFLGHLMHITQRRLVRFVLLWCSIGSSLGVLVYYKYSLLFLGTWQLATGQSWSIGALFLPAGISFYTFQTLSYTIDIYRKYLNPLSAGAKTLLDWGKAFMDFAFYISFFPQLVAGPIVRAADFLPQIRKPLSLSREHMGQGLVLIMSGLFKKVVLSDYISVNFADRVFDAPLLYSGLENLLAAYGYAVQIYCDFSGYSDMAIGLALLMGFWLPENFRRPYLADSIQNFWRRWHISLSSWLRDYLYISLGGSRKGSFRTFLSLMLTMLLGGLWHGASWVYVIWGGLHGLGLAFERFFHPQGAEDRPDRTPVTAFWLLAILQLGIQGSLLLRLADRSLEAAPFWRYTLGNGAILAVWVLMLLPALHPRAGAWLRRLVRIAFTFHFVTFGWILFRSGAIGSVQPPLQTVAEMLGQITGSFHPELVLQIVQAYPWALGLIALGLFLHYLPSVVYQTLERIYTKSPVLVQSFVFALLIWLTIQTAGSSVVPFIYFQF